MGASPQFKRTKGEYATLLNLAEERNRILLIAANILAARKLAQFDGGRKVPTTMSEIADGCGGRKRL
jgi:hypothetical protein